MKGVKKMKDTNGIKTVKVTEVDYGASNPIAELEKLAISISQRRAIIAKLEAQDDVDKEAFFDIAEKTYGYEGVKVANPVTGETVQTVYTVTQKIDDGMVKKIVGVGVWNQIKRESVDSKLFHSAIQMGIIKAIEIAPAVKDTTVRKIYVRQPAKK
jgi:hypothetical protein